MYSLKGFPSLLIFLYLASLINASSSSSSFDLTPPPTLLQPVSNSTAYESWRNPSIRSRSRNPIQNSRKLPVVINTGLSTNKYQYWIDSIVRRLSPLFSMVSLWNEKCWTPGYDQGTCYSRKECMDRGGRPYGMCAGGFGVCCTFSYTCGSVSPYNRTYLVNPEFPHSTAEPFSTCQQTITKLDGVCQLRVDFEVLELDIPNHGGECWNDRFFVTGTDMTFKPLCGDLSGHHVYLPVGLAPEITYVIQLGSDYGAWRRWKIRTTRIKCGSLMTAPGGCMQYQTGLSGRITSFNYIHGEVEESNMDQLNYGVCVRREMGFCAIQWSLCEHHKKKRRKRRKRNILQRNSQLISERNPTKSGNGSGRERRVEISSGYSGIKLAGINNKEEANSRPNFFGSNENLRCKNRTTLAGNTRTPRGNLLLFDLLSCPPELTPPNEIPRPREGDGAPPQDISYSGKIGGPQKKPTILQKKNVKGKKNKDKNTLGSATKPGGFIELFKGETKASPDGIFKLPKPSLLFRGKPVAVKAKPKPPPGGFIKHAFKPKIKAKPKPPPAGWIKHPFKPKVKPKPKPPILKKNETGNCTSKPIIIPIPIPLPIPIPIPIVPVVVVPFPFGGGGGGGGGGGWDEEEGRVMSDTEPFMIRVVTDEEREEGLSSFCMDWEQIPCDSWWHISQMAKEEKRSSLGHNRRSHDEF